MPTSDRSTFGRIWVVGLVSVAVGFGSFAAIEATRPYEGESWGPITAFGAGLIGAGWALPPFLLGHFLLRRAPVAVELATLTSGFLLGLEVSRLRLVNPVYSFAYCFVGTLAISGLLRLLSFVWGRRP